LYEVSDVEAALAVARTECELVVCTRSGDGVAIQRGDERVDVPVQPVTPVDATGAGDQFAAGFLYGLVNARSLSDAGRMGCIAASEVISHVGPRPEADLRQLFVAEGL
ncbi:MAG: PfkB family carbohydrate kinase, partial [Pseudomonadota bacterium]